MIKFFRKIRFDPMEKNKTGKYIKYAIGEIVLVVIGILIALSINNWNENRINKLKETQYLESFKDDLQANRIEIQRVIRKSELTRNVSDSILRYKSKDTNNFSLAQLDTLILGATGFTVYQTHEGTVQDILGSGVLNIIKNDSIRHAIGSWQASLKNIREWEKLDIESANQYMQYLKQHIDIFKTINKEGILTEKDKETIFNDRLFLNHLDSRSKTPNVLIKLYRKELPKLERVISLINTEITKTQQ